MLHLEDFVCEFLHCGHQDLKLIDDVNYDWSDIFEYVKPIGEEFDINSLMSAVIEYGITQLEGDVSERRDELTDKIVSNNFTPEERKEYDEIYHLDATSDVGYEVNGLDTRVFFKKNKEEYIKYFKDSIGYFGYMTGFDIR